MIHLFVAVFFSGAASVLLAAITPAKHVVPVMFSGLLLILSGALAVIP